VSPKAADRLEKEKGLPRFFSPARRVPCFRFGGWSSFGFLHPMRPVFKETNQFRRG